MDTATWSVAGDGGGLCLILIFFLILSAPW